MILCKYSVGIILLICLIVSVSPISAYSIETQNDSDSSMLSDMDVLTSVDPMETLSTNNTNNSDTYPKNKINNHLQPSFTNVFSLVVPVLLISGTVIGILTLPPFSIPILLLGISGYSLGCLLIISGALIATICNWHYPLF